ncbi:hypothetical protein AWC38_SpisGene9614 [Stylophora pistillata]|uniref:Reverse transcriptase domain-containing protein n=1 Tax=Stylophora pistillata TaxID=50429 RepID=A0A2B4SBB1_STYPI|nr:hypothetical protein AWC38_SpisGene9614 [Stylophora pistillata]
MESFCTDFIDVFSDEQCTDLSSLVDKYDTTLLSLIDKHAPVKHRWITVRPKALWYTPELAEQKRIRRNLERKWRLTRLPSDRLRYVNQCNVVVNLIARLKSDYYSSIIEHHSYDQKMLFSTVNKLLQKSTPKRYPICHDNAALANSFGDFFSEKIDKIHHSLLAKQDAISNDLTLEPPTEISTSFYDFVEKPAADHNQYANFRPVSNPTLVSKIIEKSVAVQLTDYITKHHLDLSAAFEKVNHSILLSRLEQRFGVKGKVIQWIKSYLMDREQFVQIENFGDEKICPAESTTNLTVFFDQHLTMDEQVKKVCQASYYHLRNISKIRKYLSPKTAEIVIHAYITSKMDNCNSLLYGLPDYMINKRQSIQNAVAARVITLTKKWEHITPALKKLHWLPVKYRIIFKILLLVYKGLHGLAPTYIAELLHQRNYGSGVLRSSSQMLLMVPRTFPKNYGDRAFSIAGPKLWNDLPYSLKTSESVAIFKKNLKTYLFKDAF